MIEFKLQAVTLPRPVYWPGEDLNMEIISVVQSLSF